MSVCVNFSIYQSGVLLEWGPGRVGRRLMGCVYAACGGLRHLSNRNLEQEDYLAKYSLAQ